MNVMTPCRTRILAVALCALALSCGIGNRTRGPGVPFGPDGIDFARLEHELPLEPEDLMKITPANIKLLTQEQVDQIYARLSAGPIPEGAFDGDLFFAQGEDQSRLAEIIGGRVRAHAFTPDEGQGESAGAARRIRDRLKARIVDAKLASVESLGRALWKGKVFYREQRLLRNRIEDLALVSALLGEDRARIQELKDTGDDLFFPAKLYCGQSLLDGRRESVIIDYAFTDELPGYIEPIDRLVGRHGLQIRDEIRMVRPGFYLGRAYIRRAFALNFTLIQKDVADAPHPEFMRGETAEDCWLGPQREQRPPGSASAALARP
jgi:hypothetical protein